MKSNTQ